MKRLFLMISAIVLLSACGGSKNQSQLQVVNQSPTPDATAVSTDATISTTFSESIDPSTVNKNSFMLSNQSDTVSGTFQTFGNNVVFTPSKPLSLLSKYTATISPTIHGALGQLLLEPSQWSFTTRDGLWDTLPKPPQASDPNTAKVAIDDNGRVLLVWATTSGSYVSSAFDNGAWTAASLLWQGDLNSVISANDSYAVFSQVRNGSTIELYCSRYVGGAWQPTELVAAVDATSLYVIPTIFSDNSLFVIYWYYGGADGSHAYSRRFINNQGWQTSVALGDQTASWYVGGFHRSGKAVIAWVSPNSTSGTAFAQCYDVSSGWSSPVAIGQYEFLTAHSAAVNSSGQSMVAFSTSNDIKIASTRSSADWTQLTPVYQKQPAVFYTPPQIAMDNLGNAMLVATEGAASSRYFAIRYDSKYGWQQPVDISGGRIPDPLQLGNTLKVDESGNYLLLWYGYDTLPGGIEHVYSSRYQYGVGWYTPVILGRQDADALFAKVAMNQRGEAVAVWSNFYPPGDANFTMSLGVGLFH
jgi:Bacterial Ig-like domain